MASPDPIADGPRARPRRSCLVVPGSSVARMAAAASALADEVVLDLEDGVVDAAKDRARAQVVEALHGGDWGDRTVAVRVNAIASRWVYRDLVDVLEQAGEQLDCVVVPKVQAPGEVEFVDHLLRMISDDRGFEHEIGIEAQIGNAPGLTLIDEIAFASDRLEALVFSPGDMAAALGMPALTVGEVVAGYPGDPWHAVLLRILVAARSAGLQAVDGVFADAADLDGYREVARRSAALGYDGKWAVDAAQADAANAAYMPNRAQVERAQDVLAAAAGGAEVDDAARRMAEVITLRARASRA